MKKEIKWAYLAIAGVCFAPVVAFTLLPFHYDFTTAIGFSIWTFFLFMIGITFLALFVTSLFSKGSEKFSTQRGGLSRWHILIAAIVGTVILASQNYISCSWMPYWTFVFPVTIVLVIVWLVGQ